MDQKKDAARKQAEQEFVESVQSWSQFSQHGHIRSFWKSVDEQIERYRAGVQPQDKQGAIDGLKKLTLPNTEMLTKRRKFEQAIADAREKLDRFSS